MKHLLFLFITINALTSVSVYAAEDHSTEAHEAHEEHEEHEKSFSQIDTNMAQQLGIVTSIAAAQELEQSISLYGSLTSGPEQISHVRARFQGLIKSVAVSIGDLVKTGDLLAEVESNDSLKVYRIRAPISGRVLQRHANIGEFTQDQVLFSIVNLDTLWAELRVFPSQQPSVSAGQAVRLLGGDKSMDTKIDHVLPSLDSPYQLARFKLNNTDQSLSPGLIVEAEVVIDRFPVDLAVHADAIQEINSRKGVFIKDADTYSFTPLVLGRRDDAFVEVLQGLDENDEYVSENSYLLKADLEKNEAEHDH